MTDKFQVPTDLVPDPEEGATWIKATASNSFSNCVEVARLPDGAVGVRDSKDPEGPVLRFTPQEWAAFLEGAMAGEFGHLAGL